MLGWFLDWVCVDWQDYRKYAEGLVEKLRQEYKEGARAINATMTSSSADGEEALSFLLMWLIVLHFFFRKEAVCHIEMCRWCSHRAEISSWTNHSEPIFSHNILLWFTCKLRLTVRMSSRLVGRQAVCSKKRAWVSTKTKKYPPHMPRFVLLLRWFATVSVIYKRRSWTDRDPSRPSIFSGRKIYKRHSSEQVRCFTLYSTQNDWLVDDDSVEVEPHTPLRLKDGDLIGVGNTELLVHVTDLGDEENSEF